MKTGCGGGELERVAVGDGGSGGSGRRQGRCSGGTEARLRK